MFLISTFLLICFLFFSPCAPPSLWLIRLLLRLYDYVLRHRNSRFSIDVYWKNIYIYIYNLVTLQCYSAQKVEVIFWKPPQIHRIMKFIFGVLCLFLYLFQVSFIRETSCNIGWKLSGWDYDVHNLFASLLIALAMEMPACYPSIALRALKKALFFHRRKESIDVLRYRLVNIIQHRILAFW